MKFSELLKMGSMDNKKAFILGLVYAWPIFSKDEKILLAYSSYKKGDRESNPIKGDDDLEFYKKQHIAKLKKFIGEEFNILDNQVIKNTNKQFDKKVLTGVSIVFENDIKKEKIYGVIEKLLIDTDDEFKKYFLVGFMEGRGSLDFTGHFYTVDLAQKDFPELARRKLNRMNDILGMIYNYNPRVLQEKSFKKNDQFRVNLEYFAGHYGFFRPHIIKYYKKEKNITVSKLDDNILFIDDVFAEKELPIKTKNFEVNEFVISLKGLTKEEKLKRIQDYRMDRFDFDTDDEILYSSYNTKEKAKANAGYACEFNKHHNTFISKSTDKYYVEAHHLIPFSKRKKFDVNIDVEENLVALCPNCHRRIHLAKDDERIILLRSLFSLRKEKLKNQMINLDIDKLYEMYGVKNN